MILVPTRVHTDKTAHNGGAIILEALKNDESKGKGIFPSFEDRNNYLTKCK